MKENQSLKKVTVIIPNYNGMAFLPGCLDSLEKQTSSNFAILMIDNASGDGSVEWMREHYPDVELIVNEENLGFSGAVNQGILASTTPYVILLNNDTEVEEHYIEAMIEAIESSEKVFSVSAKMIRYHERSLMDDAGDLYNLIGWAFQRGIAQPVERYEKNLVPVFSACAGAAIYRREVFAEIGLFDLMHFAYLEDIDVGYRARIYGYRNLYCSKAIVYHVGSGTSADGNKYNSFKVKLAARNNVYLNYKNMPLLQRALNWLPLMAGQLLKQHFFTKIGYGEDYRAGLNEGKQTRKQCKRVPFQWRNLWNYIVIEWELFRNMFVYAWEYTRRRI